jgi:chromosome segregation protein
MRLRSIELAGFKSFADRTTIKFQPGMTGIVGPNGCGKSNIVDGLKWVLGTLSHKAVRGDEMMDVIFKGAEGVGPSGFAEVRLTFENQDRALALEADEVCIGRRLYRSGESLYMINGAQCRRRDIRELFFGTGVGADTYSIIEQGKINRLILASPEERRLVFDEAAGVSKYRARKKEAEQRLAHVEHDLQRIEDRVTEASRELHSLRIQAGRAARHKELTDALRERSLLLVGCEARALEERRAEARGKAERARDERAGLERALAETRAALVERRQTLSLAERGHEQARGAEGRIQERRERFRVVLEQVEARVAEAKLDRERLLAQQEALEARRGQIDEKIGRTAQERGAAGVAREAARQSVQEFEGRAAEAARECRALEERLEAHNAEILELAAKQAERANEQRAIERELEQQRARETRLTERSGALERDCGELSAQQEGLRRRLAGLRTALEERRQAKAGLDREMEGLREALERARTECDALRADRDRLGARLETLREIELNREGIGSGARALLAAAPEASGDARGTVADWVEVPLPYAPAIEAALGEAAAYVVVPDAAAARRAADYVRTHRLDRTGIAPLDGPPASPAPAPGSSDPSIIGRAVDLVAPRPEARGLLARLLGDTVVAREPVTLDRPVATLAGELIRPDGTRIVRGDAQPAGVITRRAEVRVLTGETAALEARVREAEEQIAATRIGMKTVGDRIDAAREEIYQQTVREGEWAAEDQQLERRRRLAADERRAVEAELADLAREREVLTARHARSAQLADETAAAHRQALAELEQLRERARAFARERERVEGALASARADLAKYEELLRSLDRQEADYEAERAQAAEAAARLAESAAHLARRREASARERDEAIAGRDALEAECAGLAEQLRRAEEALARARADVAASEAQASEHEGALAQNEEERRSLEIALSEEEVRFEHLTQRLREEFQMSPGDLASQPAPEQTVDRAALEAQVQELRGKIERFGAFNALALERLKEVEERAAFLEAQQADLRASRDKLGAMIKELNEEAARRFEETLQKVREHFGEIFRKLFGGGKADVVLQQQEGVDPMDWGVEIMARPPKKELTTLSLLSGGEQSLTAIALVMALFKANPSPFCVLDEADAALDESNVDRYTALVQDFVQRTQVILITHRRRTMAAADVLYGVSMERAGVTKLVNVDFKRIEEVLPAAN